MSICESLTDEEHRVFKEITKRIPTKGIVKKSTADIAVVLGMTSTSVRSCLDGLVEAGAIRFNDSGGIVPSEKCKHRNENHSQFDTLTNTNKATNTNNNSSSNRAIRKNISLTHFVRKTNNLSSAQVRLKNPTKPKSISQWNSQDLVKYFNSEQAWKLKSKIGPGFKTNFPALTRHFKEMLKEASPEEVKKSIDLFMNWASKQKKLHDTPWKIYLNKRQMVWNRVRETQIDSKNEEKRFDKDYWTAWSK